jgi:transcription initiation factor TFIID TATA-box-binding protein
MSYEIVNIVTSGTLGQKVNLINLFKLLPDVFSYDPEGYHGGYLKLSKYTATIYSTGKYIVPGVKSIDDISSNHEEIMNLLGGVVDDKLIQRAEIRNIVACSNIGHDLDLPLLFTELMNSTDYEITYEPEVFPGMCIRTDIGSSNVYRNGKYLLLGALSIKQLEQLDSKIRSLIDC